MAKGSKDPLEGMKLRIIMGRADLEGTALAGVQIVTKEDLKADLWFRVDEQGIRFQYLQLEGDDIDSSSIRLPLTAIKKWVVKQIQERHDLMSIGAMFGDEGQRAAVETVFQRSKAELGLTVKNRDHWAYIAETYLSCCQIHPSEPIVCLKTRLEEKEEFWSRSKVANEVKRARQLDWLTPSTRGKAGAEPGLKLIAWRKENA
jgi:hypothetical protein